MIKSKGYQFTITWSPACKKNWIHKRMVDGWRASAIDCQQRRGGKVLNCEYFVGSLETKDEMRIYLLRFFSALKTKEIISNYVIKQAVININ